MADEAQTAGTPSPDGGDAALEPTTGTLETDGRDAAANEPDYKQLYYRSKDTIEERNQRIRELEQPRIEQQPPAVDSSLVEMQYRQMLDAAEAQGGYNAAWAIKEKQRLKREAEQQARDSELQEVAQIMFSTLPEEQRAVVTEYAQNRNKYGSFQDAQREMTMRKREAEIAKREAEIKRKESANAVPTDTRERSSIGTMPATMTRSEWRARQAALENDDDRRLAEQRAVRLGKVKLVD